MTHAPFRPYRDGAFRVLALAVALAALAFATMVLFRAELQARVAERSAETLGGSLVLEGTRAPEPAQTEVPDGVRRAAAHTFPTVILAGDASLLAGVKAVTDGYPLLGTLSVAPGRFADAVPRESGPAPGTVWVADAVIDRLPVTVGDRIEIGRAELEIAGVVRREPDQGAAFYSVNPRVLMHADDLPAADLLGPGSRVTHRTLFDGPPAAIADLRARLAADLRPDQSLHGPGDAAIRALGPLQQLALYVTLGVLLVVLLCGAAVHLATARRAARRARLAALLRTFGAPRRRVVTRLLGGELVALAPAATLGVAAGTALILAARAALGWHGPLAAGAGHWLAVAAGPFVLWLVFGLPQILGLARRPVAGLLRGETGGVGTAGQVAFAAGLGSLLAVSAWLTGSLAETGILLALLVAAVVGLPLLLWPVLKGLDWLSPRLPLATRLAVRRLSRRPRIALPLLAALTVSMAVLALSGQAGRELLDDWRARLPEKAPNHFVLNVFDRDLPALDAWLERHDAIAKPRYPVVRARLVEIDGKPVREAVTKEVRESENALNRDLVLTETDSVPPSNRVAEGEWFGPGADGGVSVERELAQALSLEIGDELTFVGAGGTLQARVTSLREVDWESFAPNFYFIFAPGSLPESQITWLTSFWLPPGDGARLAELLREMPQATVLDVEALLDRAQAVISQATRATGLLALLLMGAALLVLAAALLAMAEARARDNALLRALGADSRLLRRVAWRESLAWGAFAGTTATAAVFAALVPLGNLLLDGTLPWSAWQALPALAALAVAAAGTRLGRAARRTPPMRLLADA
ncbi:efflux ABC transporter permease [Salinisphaera sp. PC39]|uniref:ABC transporter permease n=1 Tax=Salinisphaera sp. PC39 TaxID=1304156 RepID=UPI0033428C7E